MGWSDHKFSDQYQEARKQIKDNPFADRFKAQRDALLKVMTDNGFEASAATALDDARSTFRRVAPGEASGTLEDTRILSAIGYSNGGAMDAATRQKAAALKFLSHVYLLKERGGQKVWIHSLPTDFTDWPHWAVVAGSPDYARSLLRASTERFSNQEKKHLSDAMLDGLRWCQKTLTLLTNFAGAGRDKGAAEQMIRRWFADEHTDGTQLSAHAADLTTGFKGILAAFNRNQIVLTDFPTLRTATSGAEKGLRGSEAFVWGKTSREKIDVIYVEDEFFGTKNTMKGKENWTRILVHELSHLIHGTVDVKPGPRYSWYGIGPNAANFPSSAAVTNADSWAFFAADCAGALTDTERNKALTKK
jgi:hypothetical protein